MQIAQRMVQPGGDEHVLATEASMRVALDATADQAWRIFYPDSRMVKIPRPYRSALYPLTSHVLAAYLTDIAWRCSDAKLWRTDSPASRVDGALRRATAASGRIADAWYPMLFLPHRQRVNPPFPDFSSEVQVRDLFHARLAIKSNFLSLFRAMHCVSLIAADHPRAEGVSVQQGIWLDVYERDFDGFLHELASLRQLAIPDV